MYGSVFRPGLFEGQTIMVTGGGSGIGRCVAHELASLGAVVVITGRKLEKLERTAGEIRADSIHVVVCPGELDQHMRMLAGRWTVEFLAELNFAVAFVSAAGLTLDQIGRAHV